MILSLKIIISTLPRDIKSKILILFFINYKKWFVFLKFKLQKKKKIYILNKTRIKYIL